MVKDREEMSSDEIRRQRRKQRILEQSSKRLDRICSNVSGKISQQDSNTDQPITDKPNDGMSDDHKLELVEELNREFSKKKLEKRIHSIESPSPAVIQSASSSFDDTSSMEKESEQSPNLNVVSRREISAIFISWLMFFGGVMSLIFLSYVSLKDSGVNLDLEKIDANTFTRILSFSNDLVTHGIVNTAFFNRTVAENIQLDLFNAHYDSAGTLSTIFLSICMGAFAFKILFAGNEPRAGTLQLIWTMISWYFPLFIFGLGTGVMFIQIMAQYWLND